MPPDSPNPQQEAALSIPQVSESERYAMVAAKHMEGKGWLEFEAMAIELSWRHAQLTAALRWLKKESLTYVVESKVSRGAAKVRITKVAAEEKQARQLSTDIIVQLVKLYVNLKHTDRNREKLAYEVRTIATRFAPFLENREFQIQYKKIMRQLNEPQRENQENHMDAHAQIPDAVMNPAQPQINSAQSQIEPYVSVPLLGGRGSLGFDRRTLPRLILIATIITCGLMIAIFLATTFLHAMDLLAPYVERINMQGEF